MPFKQQAIKPSFWRWDARSIGAIIFGVIVAAILIGLGIFFFHWLLTASAIAGAVGSVAFSLTVSAEVVLGVAIGATALLSGVISVFLAQGFIGLVDYIKMDIDDALAPDYEDMVKEKNKTFLSTPISDKSKQEGRLLIGPPAWMFGRRFSEMESDISSSEEGQEDEPILIS